MSQQPAPKGNVKIEIEARLKAQYAPKMLLVVDDSHKHAGHAGADHPLGETHFHVQLVSDKFRGQTKVERQRDVAKLLKDLLQTRVHALQLHTFTPEEYAKRH